MKGKSLFLIFLCLSHFCSLRSSIASETREPYKKLKDSSLYINRRCVRIENKEEYIPGSYFSPGYVKYWKEHVQIKCPKRFQSKTCFIHKYNEEYIPGTKYSPGYVTSWHEEISVPCKNKDKINKNLLRNSNRSSN